MFIQVRINNLRFFILKVLLKNYAISQFTISTAIILEKN